MTAKRLAVPLVAVWIVAVRIVAVPLAAMPIMAMPIVAVLVLVAVTTPAHAQLLDGASASVRGGDYDAGDDDDDDDSNDYDQDSDEGPIASSSSAVRGSGSSARSRGGSGGSSASYGGGYGGGGYGGRGYGGPSEPEAMIAGRVALEGGYVLAGAARAGASAYLDVGIVTLGTRYSLFVESVDTGIRFAALGRLGLSLRLVDEELFALRIGAGARHFQDTQGGVFGADVEGGFDVCPVDILVISVDAGVGFVGEALVVQVRASIGVRLENYEIYAGYNYEALFGERVAVDLGGPMLGLRVWL